MTVPTVAAGQQLLATDTNTHIAQTNANTNKLSQPNGATESGGYFLAGNAQMTSGTVSNYIGVTSRGNTLASVSIDTSRQGPTGGVDGSGIQTGNLSASGFQAFFITTGTGNNNPRCGGNWTATF